MPQINIRQLTVEPNEILCIASPHFEIMLGNKYCINLGHIFITYYSFHTLQTERAISSACSTLCTKENTNSKPKLQKKIMNYVTKESPIYKQIHDKTYIFYLNYDTNIEISHLKHSNKRKLNMT